MSYTPPNSMERGYLLPFGHKNLGDLLKQPKGLPGPSPFLIEKVRVNGQIRGREVRVIGMGGQQLGIMKLVKALRLARSLGADLVEIAPDARPPVCRIIDYGKFLCEAMERRKGKHGKSNN